jgi:RNA polymerase primary sigma factor
MQKEQADDLLTTAEVRLILDGPMESVINLASSARINAVDHKGDTPLHLAARTGRVALCDLFIRSGCDPVALNNEKLTPAEVAFSEGHYVTGELLSMITRNTIGPDESEVDASATAGPSTYDTLTATSKNLTNDKEAEPFSDVLELVEDEDPEVFFKKSTANTARGTFNPVSSILPKATGDIENTWVVDLTNTLISGDGINSLSKKTPEQPDDQDFLRVGNRGPKPVKRAAISKSTNFFISHDICLAWVKSIINKGYYSTEDIEEFIFYCEGNASFLDLQENLERLLDIAGFDRCDSAKSTEHVLELTANVSVEDLAEGVFATCNRAIRLPGTGRFDMAKKLDKARFAPIMHAKQELLLCLLGCEPAIEEILKTVEGFLLDREDQDERSKSAQALYSWSMEGRIMDGKRRREALSALDTLDLPLKTIKEILDLLSSTTHGSLSEVQKLGGKISDYEAAIKRVSLEYLPLVRRFSSRNVNEGEDPEDVFQVSFLGLYRAAMRFDPDLGDRFSLFANNGMQKFVNRWRGDESRIIRLPIHRHEKVVFFDETIEKFEAIYCRRPSVVELAHQLGWNLREVQQFLDLPRFSISIDGIEEWDEIFSELGNEEFIGDPLDNKETKLVVSLILSELKEREAEVIQKRFGIGSNEEMTLEEIGKIYDRTRERIRQIEAKAMKKLTHPARLNRIKTLLGM